MRHRNVCVKCCPDSCSSLQEMSVNRPRTTDGDQTGRTMKTFSIPSAPPDRVQQR